MSTLFFASFVFGGDFTIGYAQNKSESNRWKLKNDECHIVQPQMDQRNSSYEFLPDQSSLIRKSKTDYLSSENLTTTS